MADPSPFMIGLVGVGVGAVVTFLGQTYYAMKAQDVALINDLITDLRQIEGLSVRYWLADSNGEETRRLGDELQATVNASRGFAVDAQKILGDRYAEYLRLDGLLFDATTGGAFLTDTRKSDPARVAEIMQYSYELRALLRRSRKSQYSAH